MLLRNTTGYQLQLVDGDKIRLQRMRLYMVMSTFNTASQRIGCLNAYGEAARAYTGTKRCNDVCGIATMLNHLMDGSSNDTGSSTTPAGMNGSNNTCYGIRQQNGQAVGSTYRNRCVDGPGEQNVCLTGVHAAATAAPDRCALMHLSGLMGRCYQAGAGDQSSHIGLDVLGTIIRIRAEIETVIRGWTDTASAGGKKSMDAIPGQ